MLIKKNGYFFPPVSSCVYCLGLKCEIWTAVTLALPRPERRKKVIQCEDNNKKNDGRLKISPSSDLTVERFEKKTRLLNEKKKMVPQKNFFPFVCNRKEKEGKMKRRKKKKEREKKRNPLGRSRNKKGKGKHPCQKNSSSLLLAWLH